jgi:hypothetical protein
LRRERDADGSPRAEEVPEGAGRHAELLEVMHRLSNAAIRIDADFGDVPRLRLVCWHGERGDIGDVVSAGVVAVEEIEKFGEGHDDPAVAEVKGVADTEVGLNVRRGAKLIERGWRSIDRDALAIVGGGDGEGAGGLALGESTELEACRRLPTPLT